MNWIETELDRKYHPVSALFPLLEGSAYDELKADIATNGLLEAIWLHPDGSIIDGRNRHRACIETETQPRFRTWDNGGSLVSFVVSMNLHRRHLTSSQRAVVALDVLPMLEEEAKERQRLGKQKLAYPEEAGQARDQTAELFQTNRQYVSDAKRIQQEAPEDWLHGKCYNCGCWALENPWQPGEYDCPCCGDTWDIYAPPPDIP